MFEETPSQSTIPSIIVAIPIAVNPPIGAEEIATFGVDLYPPPLFVTVIFLTPPLKICAVAVAVTEDPTKVKDCI